MVSNSPPVALIQGERLLGDLQIMILFVLEGGLSAEITDRKPEILFAPRHFLCSSKKCAAAKLCVLRRKNPWRYAGYQEIIRSVTRVTEQLTLRGRNREA